VNHRYLQTGSTYCVLTDETECNFYFSAPSCNCMTHHQALQVIPDTSQVSLHQNNTTNLPFFKQFCKGPKSNSCVQLYQWTHCTYILLYFTWNTHAKRNKLSHSLKLENNYIRLEAFTATNSIASSSAMSVADKSTMFQKPFKNNCISEWHKVLCFNKIERVNSSEYTNIPKAFFMPQCIGRCCTNVFQGPLLHIVTQQYPFCSLLHSSNKGPLPLLHDNWPQTCRLPMPIGKMQVRQTGTSPSLTPEHAECLKSIILVLSHNW
jgi:hypothetical protein